MRGFSTILLLFTLALYGVASDIILVLQHEGADFDLVYENIELALEGEFELVRRIENGTLSPREMARLIDTHKPKCVVLLNNNNTRAFAAYAKGQKKGENVVPSLSLMSAFVGRETRDIPNSMAISYEVPIVTSVRSLRSLMDIDSVHLGIVYRDLLRDFIEDNRAYCEAEGIGLQTYYVPGGESRYEELLKMGLDRLVSVHNVSMIWVPNDPAFLTGRMVERVWRPFVDTTDVPVIVGVETFLSSSMNFGAFAVVPDHSALGVQAANMIFDLRDAGWVVGRTSAVEMPISIFQVLSRPFAQPLIEQGIIPNVDRVAE